MFSLVLFIRKIFYGFIIEQAVDRAVVGGRVGLVHIAYVLGSTLRRDNREHHINDQCREDDSCERCAISRKKNDDHDQQLEQRWQDVENHEAQQKADARGATLDITRQTTRSSIEMKIQIEPMKMVEGLQADATNRAFRDTAEHGVT